VRSEFLKTYPAEEEGAKVRAFNRCVLDAVACFLVTSREIEGTTFLWLTKADHET
jgi:hypothetical protein